MALHNPTIFGLLKQVPQKKSTTLLIRISEKKSILYNKYIILKEEEKIRNYKFYIDCTPQQFFDQEPNSMLWRQWLYKSSVI